LSILSCIVVAEAKFSFLTVDLDTPYFELFRSKK
jgi:hypothetical protein